MIKKITVLTAAIMLLIAETTAQTEMYQWKTYTTYDTPGQITEARNTVYFTCDGYLYAYGKSDNSLTELTRDNALTDSDIKQIEYNYEKDLLVIAYQNSNIDIISGGRIYNIPYIKEAVMTSSKTINNINIIPETDEIYISTDFGVVIINSKKYEIKNSFILGRKILDAAYYDGRYYISDSEQSIRECSDEEIPYKYENWKPSELNHIAKKIVICDGTIWTVSSTSITRYIPGVTNEKVEYGDFDTIKRNPQNEIYAYHAGKISIYNSNGTKKGETDLNDYTDDIPTDISNNNRTETYWAISREGIKSYKTANGTVTLTANIPIKDKPAVAIPYTIATQGKSLYCIPTGVNIDSEDQTLTANIARMNNYKWENILCDDIPSANNPITGKFGLTSDVAIAPYDESTIYVGTWFDGLYRFKNGSFDAVWNYTNSPITGIYDNFVNMIGALAFDADNNLWMTNYGNDFGLLAMKPDGTFVTFANSDLIDKKYFTQILIPKQSNTKWIVYGNSSGFIYAHNHNGTLENQSDDTYRKFTSFTDQDNRSIDGTQFYCAAEDLSGRIWIGTDRGPILLNRPDNFRSSNFSCYVIKIPRNDGTNTADLLLNAEVIRAIEPDDAGNIWLGTETGAYLVSEDGQTTIYHFTTENSVLPSNKIYDIKIKHDTGEVFFATEKGLVSFRAEAAEAKENYDSVYAFPNPVRPEYTGVITITGLEFNSLVKITDTTGNLIYQNYSQGGQMVWDGNRPDGQRVKSGVYYVWMSNSSNKDGKVAKIVVIN